MSNFNLDVQLETGPERGWEVRSAELNSVPESHVLAFTLSSSRERWLTSVLPKFSSKTKKNAKGGAPAPPPHSLYPRGGCDVQIGPHIFSNTNLYEAHYHPQAPTASGPFAYQQSSASSSTSTSTPTSSSIERITLTPALADQINEAAASNPTLASLLQLAVAGTASAEQLTMLSITIKSLTNPATASQYTQLNSQRAPASIAKEFDLIVEFRESLSDRFILPRGTTVCERLTTSGDIVITSYVQLQGKDVSETSAGETSSIMPRIIRITLRSASAAIWDTLNRWVGGEEKMNANRIALDKLKRSQPRKTYLAYRLPAGALVDQLRAATLSSGYIMKSIKPSAAPSRPRRVRKAVQKEPLTIETNALAAGPSSLPSVAKPARRKRSAVETDDNTSSAMDLAAVITGAASSTKYSPVQPTPTARLTVASIEDNTLHLSPSASAPSAPKKRQRTSMTAGNLPRPTVTEIKCKSCQATDVPLMLGGRFCRACVEAGRATGEIPQTPSSSRAPAYTPAYIPPPLTVTNNPYMAMSNPAAEGGLQVSYAPNAINVGQSTVTTQR